MRADFILKISLAVSLAVAAIALNAYARGAENVIYYYAFALAGIVFLIVAIPEIMRSKNLNRTEKMMWVVSLIFFFAISATVYLLLGRRRVVAENNARIPD